MGCLALVEVTTFFYKKGFKVGREMLANLESDYIWKKEVEADELQPPEERFCGEPDAYIFKEDNVSFEFKVCGEMMDLVYNSNLEIEIEQIGVDEVFRDYLEDLEKCARAALDKIKHPEPPLLYNEKKDKIWEATTQDGKVEVIRTLHVFEVVYRHYGCSYTGEEDWDSTIKHLGPVELNDILNLIKKN